LFFLIAHQQQQQYNASTHLQDEGDYEDEEQTYMMPLDTNGKTLLDVDQNGLPMELKPGDNKFRIPDFVLKNTE
jgi:hypothetical protein